MDAHRQLRPEIGIAMKFLKRIRFEHWSSWAILAAFWLVFGWFAIPHIFN
jgi:hypothetical protein